MILRLGDRWLADIEIYSMGSLRVSDYRMAWRPSIAIQFDSSEQAQAVAQLLAEEIGIPVESFVIEDSVEMAEN